MGKKDSLDKVGVSNSFVGAVHTARYHSVSGPHCFRNKTCSKCSN